MYSLMVVFQVLSQFILSYISVFRNTGFKAYFKIASIIREIWMGADFKKWRHVSEFACVCYEDSLGERCVF